MRILLITLLLIAAVTNTAASRPLAIKDGSPGGKQDTELTPEDEREAQGLAVRLMKRLRETDDFDPLVSEFFVNDFVERLRQLARDENPQSESFVFCEREIILQAGADDLRRAYLALMNFWNQQERLGDASWDYVKLENKIEGKDEIGEPGTWGRHLTLREEAVPVEAFNIARSDPLLDCLFNLIRRDNGGGDENKESLETDEEKGKAVAIRHVARLRAITDKLEQCLPMLRRAAEGLRVKTKALAAAYGLSEKPQEELEATPDEFRVYHLDSTILKTETFGLKVGEMLIRARIFPYEMAMARVDGQLKILAVYPDVDGD